MGLGSVFSLPVVNAKADNTTIKSIEEQRSGLQTDITKANQELSQVQDELTKLNETIT
jgi:peptidoglycan DL-endopeptidase CwlO